MKNLSLILNLVLLVAVAVLFYLHFAGNGPVEASNESTISTGAGAEDLRIAYINSDSLLKHYDYMDELTGELEKTQQKFESEFQNRKQGLEREIQNFQQNMNNMTRAQAMAVQEDLVQKQQNLARYQENLTQQLMQEEASKQNELYDRVANYLREYGDANKLELVLTYTKGSGVLYASDSLDITNAIIDGLNQEYNAGSEVEADSTQAE